ncbi:MAG: hypothetical protein K5848_04820 [Lachnospiraceae bacterium]|nr:hypothetical protein [Lachnospiraceae bacterium]
MKIKRLLKSIILLAFFVVLFGIACAESKGESELTQIQKDNIMGTIEYLKLVDSEYIYVACAEGNNKSVFFIYDDNSMIGLYVVYENCPAESFIIDASDELYEMVRNNDTKVYLDKGIALELAGEVYVVNIENKMSGSSGNGEIIDGVNNVTATEGNHYEIGESVAYYLIGIASEGYFLNVSHVDNADHPVYEGGGLCWCASGSSIHNYYRITHYNALSMYYKVKSMTGGIPTGTESYEKAVFTLVSRLNYVFLAGKPNYNSVKQSLANGSPLMTCFYCDAENVAHAVVLCGLLHIQNSYGYIYMDPNVGSGYVVNYQDYSYLNNSSNTIYYCAGDTIYNRMRRSFRNFTKMS